MVINYIFSKPQDIGEGIVKIKLHKNNIMIHGLEPCTGIPLEI